MKKHIYLIKEDVQNVLFLQALRNWHWGTLLQSRDFEAWSFTLGFHWSWSKNHRGLLWRCSAGTTSATCYQKSGPRRLFYFSAGQCSSPQSRRNHRNAKERHTRLPPTLWPPDSQDLNPVDHKVWSVMEEQVCYTPIHDINYLKQCLLDVWAEWSKDQWRPN